MKIEIDVEQVAKDAFMLNGWLNGGELPSREQIDLVRGIVGYLSSPGYVCRFMQHQQERYVAFDTKAFKA